MRGRAATYFVSPEKVFRFWQAVFVTLDEEEEEEKKRRTHNELSL